jgi:hypothetical protein
MSSGLNNMKFMTIPLSSFLNRGLEFAKVRAQEKNLRLSERQRIGRDGCVQAIIAQFLTLTESDQDAWIANGVKVLIDKQN